MSSRIPAEIPPEDKITLSPLDKYRIYGKFPYHMIIHILLLIFNSIQAIILLPEYTNYFREQEKSFINTLVNQDYKERKQISRKAYLYDISSLQEHMSTSMQKMFNANKTFLNNINFLNKENEEINLEYVDMQVIYKINLSNFNIEQSPIPISFHYNVTPDFLGPINKNYTNDEIKNYLNLINYYELNYKLKIYMSQYYKKHKICFIWKIRQIYDFSKRAHIEVVLDINNQQCDECSTLSRFEIIMVSHLWIHLISFILASFSIFFCLYDFYEVIHLRKYRRMILKSQKNKRYKNLKLLKAAEIIAKAFNKWDLLIIISNICQIIGSILGFMQQKNVYDSMDKYIGLGGFLCIISIGKYIDYSPTYSFFNRTVINTLPDLIPSIASIMPVFIAFTFLGLMLFWDSERFTCVSDIMKALFAVYVGDSVYDVITDITDKSNFLGQIFGYVFTILFIIVVMNVFVAVIQEGFMKTKFDNRSYWIYNTLFRNDDFVNDSIKNLPNIDEMSQSEIKEELENRLILMNKGLNQCTNLIDDVEKSDIDEESKNELRKILFGKIEEIDYKMEVIRVVWENK